MVSAGANQELDKIKEMNKVIYQEDYCSFCGGFMSKMVNHTTAHRLKNKMFRETIPAKPDLEKELELLNSYFWYSQDRTKPEHLRPKDPRLEEYLEKERKMDERRENKNVSKR